MSVSSMNYHSVGKSISDSVKMQINIQIGLHAQLNKIDLLLFTRVAMQFIRISFVYYYFIAYSVVVRIPLKVDHFVVLCSLRREWCYNNEGGENIRWKLIHSLSTARKPCCTEAICWDKHCIALFAILFAMLLWWVCTFVAIVRHWMEWHKKGTNCFALIWFVSHYCCSLLVYLHGCLYDWTQCNYGYCDCSAHCVKLN